MIELAIRNGLVVDGTGAGPRAGDVGVDDGRIVAVGTRARGRAGDRRGREGDRAGVHRHPQPLGLHAARRSARVERRPSGRDDRSRRELRLRLLPAPEQGAGAEGDLRALVGGPADLDVGLGVLRAARGGAAGDQRREPRPERADPPLGRRARGPPGPAGRAGADALPPGRGAGTGRLRLLDRPRVRGRARRERGRARLDVRGVRTAPRPLRDAHAAAGRGRR